MSFGFSVGDVVSLLELAFKTVQNSRKACGEHADLTQEALTLNSVLQRLQQEILKLDSPISNNSSSNIQELALIIRGCEKVLRTLNNVLEKYNALGDQERSTRKLWAKIRFGNGQVANMRDIRAQITYYSSALSLYLNMESLGAIGRVEKQMNDAGGDLKEIKTAVNGITAHLMASAGEERSVLTTYADDDAAIWREFRRELIKDGFSSDVIRRYKTTIQAYVKELGSRGVLDEPSSLTSLENTLVDKQPFEEVGPSANVNTTSQKPTISSLKEGNPLTSVDNAMGYTKLIGQHAPTVNVKMDIQGSIPTTLGTSTFPDNATIRNQVVSREYESDADGIIAPKADSDYD